MDDDFNTPLAISVLAEVRRELNTAKASNTKVKASEYAGILKSLGSVLGILQLNPKEYFTAIQTHHVLKAETGHIQLTGHPAQLRVGFSEEKINELIDKRNEARRNKKWAESDRIRDELKAQGIVLEDGPAGTIWRRE